MHIYGFTVDDIGVAATLGRGFNGMNISYAEMMIDHSINPMALAHAWINSTPRDFDVLAYILGRIPEPWMFTEGVKPVFLCACVEANHIPTVTKLLSFPGINIVHPELCVVLAKNNNASVDLVINKIKETQIWTFQSGSLGVWITDSLWSFFDSEKRDMNLLNRKISLVRRKLKPSGEQNLVSDFFHPKMLPRTLDELFVWKHLVKKLDVRMNIGPEQTEVKRLVESVETHKTHELLAELVFLLLEDFEVHPMLVELALKGMPMLNLRILLCGLTPNASPGEAKVADRVKKRKAEETCETAFDISSIERHFLWNNFMLKRVLGILGSRDATAVPAV
jgi:hypothetical protein